MTYADEWSALSARILGLIEAGELHARFMSIRGVDSYGRSKRLRDQADDILALLLTFRDRFADLLPASAVAAIDIFLKTTGPLIKDKEGSQDSREEKVWAALVMLGAFQAEISFLLSSPQEGIRSRSELAFSHLQRSIVVDGDIRAKWQKAYDDGEVPCEQLGAVHLLLHGIWAFKVDAAGARTDLVFQQPAGQFVREARFASGLVLTEWKLARKNDEPAKRFEAARNQAQRYAEDALLANELTDYRYAIVVSEGQLEVPDDFRIGHTLYRHINIAVKPAVPSRAKPPKR